MKQKLPAFAGIVLVALALWAGCKKPSPFGDELFDKDLAASLQITPQLWRERPLTLRVKEQAARIWVYWL